MKRSEVTSFPGNILSILTNRILVLEHFPTNRNFWGLIFEYPKRTFTLLIYSRKKRGVKINLSRKYFCVQVLYGQGQSVAHYIRIHIFVYTSCGFFHHRNIIFLISYIGFTALDIVSMTRFTKFWKWVYSWIIFDAGTLPSKIYFFWNLKNRGPNLNFHLSKFTVTNGRLTDVSIRSSKRIVVMRLSVNVLPKERCSQFF